MSGSSLQFTSSHSLVADFHLNLYLHCQGLMIALRLMDLLLFLTMKCMLVKIWCHLIPLQLNLHFPDVTNFKFRHLSPQSAMCEINCWDAFSHTRSRFKHGGRNTTMCWGNTTHHFRSVPAVMIHLAAVGATAATFTGVTSVKGVRLCGILILHRSMSALSVRQSRDMIWHWASSYGQLGA